MRQVRLIVQPANSQELLEGTTFILVPQNIPVKGQRVSELLLIRSHYLCERFQSCFCNSSKKINVWVARFPSVSATCESNSESWTISATLLSPIKASLWSDCCCNNSNHTKARYVWWLFLIPFTRLKTNKYLLVLLDYGQNHKYDYFTQYSCYFNLRIKSSIYWMYRVNRWCLFWVSSLPEWAGKSSSSVCRSLFISVTLHTSWRSYLFSYQ